MTQIGQMATDFIVLKINSYPCRYVLSAFNDNTPPFPDTGFVVDEGDDQSDRDADPDRPPDPAAPQPVTEEIGKGDTDQPEADQAGDHRE